MHIFRSNFESFGWQSWSPCGIPQHPFSLLRNYTPHSTQNICIRIPAQTSIQKPVTGWCSWYAYGSHISQARILDHSSWIVRHKLPLTYILIDDGWTKWGDWSTWDDTKFPQGIPSCTRTIVNTYHKKPGLWIAPFLVDPRSELSRQHNDWLVRTEHTGNLVEGRKLTHGDAYVPYRRWILDITRKDAYRYIMRCIDTMITKWNISLLKLDFLYAMHFHPRLSHQQADTVLTSFLHDISTSYPSIITLASGCPLLPAMGEVDAMRISEDIVNPQLRSIPILRSIIHKKRLNQLIKNYHTRKWTQKFWLIDPDVFICDPLYGLSTRDITTLSTIIRASGVKMLGDNLLTLPRKHIPLLTHVLS